MEYIYAALMLHRAGKPVTEETVKKVLHAGGITTDDGRVRALVAALEGVNIDEAVKSAMVATVAAPAAAPAAEAKEEKKEQKQDAKKQEEAAMAGLGALFG